MKFHHIGLVTTEEKPGENYFEALKCYGTNPDDDPVNRVEWVRFTPESPLADTLVGKMSHVSYQVDDLDVALADIKPEDIVIGPLQAADGVRIAYFTQAGCLVEYLEIK